MDLNLRITDLAGAVPSHSMVIVNFVAAVRKQLKTVPAMFFRTMSNTNSGRIMERRRLLYRMRPLIAV